MTTESEKIERLEEKSQNYVTFSIFFTMIGIFLGIVAAIFSYQVSRIAAAEAKLETMNDIKVQIAQIQTDILYIRKSLDAH